MSRWISQEAERLAPYTPGEQPQDQQYVKLNTNESPFPPSPKVLKAINRAEILKLNLYSDPTCAALTEAIARRYELKAKNVLAGNGSDEVLAFAFRAFCGQGKRQDVQHALAVRLSGIRHESDGRSVALGFLGEPGGRAGMQSVAEPEPALDADTVWGLLQFLLSHVENPLYHYAACVAAAVRVKSRGLSRSGRPGLSERAGRERVSR